MTVIRVSIANHYHISRLVVNVCVRKEASACLRVPVYHQHYNHGHADADDCSLYRLVLDIDKTIMMDEILYYCAADTYTYSYLVQTIAMRMQMVIQCILSR